MSFQPTYNTATNRVTTVGGQSFSYDSNGNTLNDTFRTYAWDAEGHATTVGSVSATYDALGRVVESGTTQIVYTPTGQKFALMSGQTVTKAFVPLPGGAQAVYVGTTLTYYRHADWLGSARLTTTQSRTMYSSLAYAPFGETYAESGTGADRSFTGQNQDTVPHSTTGLYDFLYREYAQFGRWISPDPAGLSATNLATPQSLNRYAYVMNQPTANIDPLGLFAAPGDDPCPSGYHYVPNAEADCYPNQGGGGVQPIFIRTSGPDGPPPSTVDGGGGAPCLAGAGPLAPGQSRCPAANNCAPGSPGCYNVPTQEQQCLTDYYNSRLGKVIEFGSVLSMVPGWDPNPGKNLVDNVILVGGKYLGLRSLASLGQASVPSIITGGSTSIATGTVERAVGWLAGKALTGVSYAGPVGVVAATAIDINAHTACTPGGADAIMTVAP